MSLQKLILKNFRLFDQKQLSFSKQTTLILGPNASGKTNIMEAIYLLATGKSFRASREVEMIKNGQDIAFVSAKVDSNTQLEIILTTGEIQGKKVRKKQYKVNGVAKRWKDFVANLTCVLFRPEDIDIILGSPSIRRNYLDLVLESIDWQYRACNLTYQKGLRQRNRLLDRIRQGEAQFSQLTFWNQLLIKNGSLVSQKRAEMIDFFNQFLANCDRLYQEKRKVELVYDKSIISQQRLEKYQPAELALGATLVGPHRDDIIFKVQPCRETADNKFSDNRNLSLYGSRGEQRMAIFSLKLAEVEFILNKTKQRPILLLDDIFSELDKSHRQQIITIIPQQQTIITATDNDFVDKKLNDTINKIIF